MQEKRLFQGKDIFNFLVLYDFVYQSNRSSKMTFRRNCEDYFLWSFLSNYNEQDSLRASKWTQKLHESIPTKALCKKQNENQVIIHWKLTQSRKCPIYEYHISVRAFQSVVWYCSQNWSEWFVWVELTDAIVAFPPSGRTVLWNCSNYISISIFIVLFWTLKTCICIQDNCMEWATDTNKIFTFVFNRRKAYRLEMTWGWTNKWQKIDF